MELGTMISQLGVGMITSIEIFVLTLVFSLPLGLLVAFGRMSKIAPIRLFTKIYISIMRGTPLMLQLMVVFFGPYYIFGINISNINVSQNKLLQDDLKYFEEEIQSPNNDYPKESYIINKNAVSKIADKIDMTKFTL